MSKKKRRSPKRDPIDFFSEEDGFSGHYREASLETFGEQEPNMREDGAIVDGRGHILIRLS